MNWKFDEVADAAYLRLSEGKIARTLQLAENVTLDVDAQGRPVGLEVLSVSKTGLDNLAAGRPAR